jgi:4-amino-4-deoxy-L-arabinose transferase-like glycosyltransferase
VSRQKARGSKAAPSLRVAPEAGRSWPLSLTVLFVTAATWRLLYLVRLSHSSLAGSMFDDARIYWAWSSRIADGHLVGSNPFFLAPLYPYVLALLRTLAGGSLSTVLIVQAVWGAAAVVLLTDATKRLATPAIGFAVGVILSFYEMAVFFDGLFLTESLMFFLGSLLLWWVVRSDWSRATWRAAGVVGVLVGLLAAGRGTATALLLPAGLLVVRRGDPGRSIRVLIVVLAGFILITIPAAMHNYVVAREWLPFTYNTGFNLYAGNNPKAAGTYVPITGNREGQPQGLDGGIELDGRDYVKRTEGLALSPSASSSYWSRKAGRYAMQNPGYVLRLSTTKLAMLWNVREYPQIENVEEYRALAGPVGLPVIGTFALLGALALIGAAFAWQAGVAGRFALGCAIVVSLSTIPFFVTDRYRHQLIPACALLAGIGLHRLWLAWSRGSDRARTFVALAAGLLIVHLPMAGPTAEQRATLLAKNMGVRFLQSGFAAARAGLLDQAEHDFAQAVRANPRQYEAWGGLIRVQVQLGHVAQARETFSKARAAGLPEVPTHAYEALFAALSHDTAAAEMALQRVPQSGLDADPNLAEVVTVTRRILSGGR